MKRVSFFLMLIIVSNLLMAQVDYYDITTHENVNVNKNVNVSGYVHQSQTVTTIDYGAFALANAERERNRLEAQKYADEQSRRQALEIAANPLKAYDYGYPIAATYRREKNQKNF